MGNLSEAERKGINSARGGFKVALDGCGVICESDVLDKMPDFGNLETCSWHPNCVAELGL